MLSEVTSKHQAIVLTPPSLDYYANMVFLSDTPSHFYVQL